MIDMWQESVTTIEALPILTCEPFNGNHGFLYSTEIAICLLCRFVITVLQTIPLGIVDALALGNQYR